jgi:hypothetical protein
MVLNFQELLLHIAFIFTLNFWQLIFSAGQFHLNPRREPVEPMVAHLMVERFKLKQANTLKHGAHSTLGPLPGGSPAAFKKYQKAVIDEFRPNGPVEHDIVFTIALALWRKQNLATLETAKLDLCWKRWWQPPDKGPRYDHSGDTSGQPQQPKIPTSPNVPPNAAPFG